MTTAAPEAPAPPLNQIAAIWRGLSPAGRWSIIIVGLVVGVGLAAMVVADQAKFGWEPLARGLSPEDEGQAIAALDEKGIRYELEGGGTILVESDRVPEARLELALSVLPGGGTEKGIELFDETEMGRTLFDQEVNLHRAMQVELARTIRYLQPVERARVHLVQPKKELFTDKQEAPSASVMVTLKPTASLSPRQVQAIRYLVSAGVEGLEPGRVAIVDQHGDVVASPDGDAWSAGLVFEKQFEYERRLERDVVALLEPVVGQGKVRARVAARLDFSRVVETKESYDPESQVIRSEREQTEKSDSVGPQAQGPPGTASNLPDRQAGATATTPGRTNTDKLDHIKNYEIDKDVVRRELPHPRVERLSVAVVVDGAAGADGESVRPRTAEELASYEAIVSKAVGLDKTRGDEIEVASAAFAPPVAEEPDDQQNDAALAYAFWRDVIIGGLIGLAMLVAVIIVLRSRKKSRERRELHAAQAARGPVYDSLRQHAEALRTQVVGKTESDVGAAAAIFRGWLDGSAEGKE